MNSKYAKLTTDAYFYLPLLFENNDYIKNYLNLIKDKKLEYTCFVKCVDDDINRPFLDNRIFIILKLWSKELNIQKTVENFEQNPNFIRSTIIYNNNSEYIVLEYRYPVKYLSDCINIKNGLYSKLKLSTKHTILEYWNIMYNSILYSGLFNITSNLNDTVFLKKNELGELLNKPFDIVPEQEEVSIKLINKKNMNDSNISLRLLNIAKVCHETNKAWCEVNGDYSQKSWDEAEDWQRQSAIKGVEFRVSNPEAGEDAQHNAWMQDKINDGWVYGEVKDTEKKTHPCIVPFKELPLFQQQKDKLFCAIVDALS